MASVSTAAEPASPRRSPRGEYTVWEIISKVAASIVGGGIVTYWMGAAIARVTVETKLLVPAEAVYLVGLLQILIFTGAVIWICASSSIKRMWIGVAVVTAICVAAALLGPKLPTAARGGGGGGGDATATSAGAAGVGQGAGGAPGAGRRGRGMGRRGAEGAGAAQAAGTSSDSN